MEKIPYFIADVGLNHMGNEKYAFQYLKSLLKTDVDGICFQVREKEFYKNKQKKNILSNDFYIKAILETHKYKKKFGISICDIDMINLFSNQKIDFFRIIMNDLVKKKLVTEVYNSKIRNILVSVGSAKLSDIFKHKSFLKKNQKIKTTYVYTKHNLDYAKSNLYGIKYLKDKLQTKNIGYINHSSNHDVISTALALDPQVIIFYVKGNKKIVHPDSKHAILLSNVKKEIERWKKIKTSLRYYKL